MKVINNIEDVPEEYHHLINNKYFARLIIYEKLSEQFIIDHNLISRYLLGIIDYQRVTKDFIKKRIREIIRRKNIL